MAPYCKEIFIRQIRAIDSPSREVDALATILIVDVPVVDDQVQVITIKIKDRNVWGVIIDGGLGANIISEEVRCKLKLKGLKPSPFRVRMEDQRPLEPLEMLSYVVIAIGGVYYTISWIVIPMV